MICTYENGKPIGAEPLRTDYPTDIEGTIAWMRDWNDFRDKVRSVASAAFDKQFRKSMRGK